MALVPQYQVSQKQTVMWVSMMEWRASIQWAEHQHYQDYVPLKKPNARNSFVIILPSYGALAALIGSILI